MAGGDAVFGPGSAHPNDFLRAEVGRDEGQSAYPGGQRATGLEEVLARLHESLECEANAQHKNEVQKHDEPVDKCQIHCALFYPSPIYFLRSPMYVCAHGTHRNCTALRTPIPCVNVRVFK